VTSKHPPNESFVARSSDGSQDIFDASLYLGASGLVYLHLRLAFLHREDQEVVYRHISTACSYLQRSLDGFDCETLQDPRKGIGLTSRSGVFVLGSILSAYIGRLDDCHQFLSLLLEQRFRSNVAVDELLYSGRGCSFDQRLKRVLSISVKVWPRRVFVGIGVCESESTCICLGLR